MLSSDRLNPENVGFTVGPCTGKKVIGPFRLHFGPGELDGRRRRAGDKEHQLQPPGECVTSPERCVPYVGDPTVPAYEPKASRVTRDPWRQHAPTAVPVRGVAPRHWGL